MSLPKNCYLRQFFTISLIFVSLCLAGFGSPPPSKDTTPIKYEKETITKSSINNTLDAAFVIAKAHPNQLQKNSLLVDLAKEYAKHELYAESYQVIDVLTESKLDTGRLRALSF